MFLGRTVFKKNTMLTCKIQSCRIILTMSIFQGIIAFFSNTERLKKIKFGVYKVYRYVNIWTKFDVPRSHSIQEKCDPNLQKLKVVYYDNPAILNFCKLESHFSRILCN